MAAVDLDTHGKAIYREPVRREPVRPNAYEISNLVGIQAAISAYNNRTATPKQMEMLKKANLLPVFDGGNTQDKIKYNHQKLVSIMGVNAAEAEHPNKSTNNGGSIFAQQPAPVVANTDSVTISANPMGQNDTAELNRVTAIQQTSAQTEVPEKEPPVTIKPVLIKAKKPAVRVPRNTSNPVNVAHKPANKEAASALTQDQFWEKYQEDKNTINNMSITAPTCSMPADYSINYSG